MGWFGRKEEQRTHIDVTKTSQAEMEDRIAEKGCNMLISRKHDDPAVDIMTFIEETARMAATETAEALKKAALLRRRDDWAYSRMNKRLYDHYTNGENDPEITAALESWKSNEYLYLIPMRYKRRMSVADIEKEIGVPGYVITRETKKIVLGLFDSMPEGGK